MNGSLLSRAGFVVFYSIQSVASFLQTSVYHMTVRNLNQAYRISGWLAFQGCWRKPTWGSPASHLHFDLRMPYGGGGGDSSDTTSSLVRHSSQIDPRRICAQNILLGYSFIPWILQLPSYPLQANLPLQTLMYNLSAYIPSSVMWLIML